MMQHRWTFALVAAATVVAAVACYAPTEVRLELTTDLACPQPVNDPAKALHAGVYLGGAVAADAVAESTSCVPNAAGNDMGSIVIVPSGARDARVTVEVAMGTEGTPSASCHPAHPSDPIGAKCIVTRRTFAFISHTSRVFPIRLTANCLGRTCSDPNETCINGECHTANADVPQDLGTPTEGLDAGAPDADAGAPDAGDASTQACVASDGSDILSGDEPPTDVLAASSKEVFWAAGNVVHYVGNHGGTVKTLDPNAANGAAPVTALAVVDDKFLLVGTRDRIHRYTLATHTLDPQQFYGQVTSIVSAPKGPYFTGPSITGLGPRISTIAPNDTVSAITPSVGGTDLAVSSSGVAYTVDTVAGGTDIHRHAPIGAAVVNVAVTPVRFLAAAEGRVYFSTPGGNSALGNVFVGGIYQVLDTNNGQDLAAQVDGARKLVTAAAIAGANPPLPGVYYAADAKGDPAIYYLAFSTGNFAMPQPQRMTTAKFANIAGLALDNDCAYFWGTSPGPNLNAASKLRVVARPRTVP